MIFKKRSMGLLLIIFFEIFMIRHSLADQQKIVLLTSMSVKNIHPWFSFFSFKDYVQGLEESFIRQFSDSRYLVEIKHDADQFDLWNVLHDPRNVAVFWLSHAGAAEGGALGENLISTHSVIDAHGFDLTPVFQKIHPNLRFLAVIGCFSKQVMDSLPHLSHDTKHPDHPYLRLFTFSHKVDAKRGLHLAMDESKKILEIPEIRLGYPAVCRNTQGYRAKVVRSFAHLEPGAEARVIRPAARLMAQDQVLGVFPSVTDSDSYGVPAQTQEMVVYSSHGDLPHLRLDVGENSELLAPSSRPEILDIGKLNLSLFGQEGSSRDLWVLWSARNGTPIGYFSQSYTAQNSSGVVGVGSMSWVEQPEFSCEPMPAYE
jgi:hypothetical protein